MRKKEWRDGNHMKFESAHATFNRQVDCISTGNVIGHVQLSGFVRPHCEIECNGFTNPPGHLQEYDLNWLMKDFPYFVKDWIRENDSGKSVIAYEFRYWKNGEKYPIGWVVTSEDYQLLDSWVHGTKKAGSALREAIAYITEGN